MTPYASDATIAAGNRLSLSVRIVPHAGVHYAPGATGYRIVTLALEPPSFLHGDHQNKANAFVKQAFVSFKKLGRSGALSSSMAQKPGRPIRSAVVQTRIAPACVGSTA